MIPVPGAPQGSKLTGSALKVQGLQFQDSILNKISEPSNPEKSNSQFQPTFRMPPMLAGAIPVVLT